MVQQLRLIESYKAHSGMAGMPACTHSIPTARLDSKGVLTTACSTARSSTLHAAVGLLAGGHKCRFVISLAFSLVKACAAVRRPQLALITLVSSVPAIICKWVCSCRNWPLVHSLGENRARGMSRRKSRVVWVGVARGALQLAQERLLHAAISRHACSWHVWSGRRRRLHNPHTAFDATPCRLLHK